MGKADDSALSKICVSLICPTAEIMLLRLEKVEFAEIRMDKIADLKEEGVKKIFAACKPTIATFRPGKISESMRAHFLKLAVESGAKYVDIELDADEKTKKEVIEFAKRKKCQVIISYHDFNSTPPLEKLLQIREKCFLQGADIAKISCMAKNEEETERVISLLDDKRKVIAIAMGEFGKKSRIENAVSGKAFTYASFSKPERAAQGQIEYKEMEKLVLERIKKEDGIGAKRAVSKESYNSGTLLFAVCGNPIMHSKSPQFQQAGFDALGINAVYFRILGENSADVLEACRQIGVKGMSITSPFKQEFAKLCGKLDADAKKLGATNTALFEGGKISGFNTDPAGVCGALESSGLKISKKNAVVIGAGGAARAAVLGLKNAGVNVVCANRTEEKAKNMAKELGCEYCSLSEKEMGGKIAKADILVSCIPSGERIIPASLLHQKLAVLDAYYAGKSALVSDAKKAGCKIIPSLDWLLYQGAESFKMFSKKPAPVDEMKKGLYAQGAHEKNKKKIALIGFMGSGKSEVAIEIGKLSGLPCFDMDSEIEREANMGISEIFEKHGEKKFRQAESSMLKKASKIKEGAVSCGGGVILNEKNRRLLKNEFAVVWLHAGSDEIIKRIGNDDKRPLMGGGDRSKKVEILLSQRMPLYASTCDFMVNTNGKTAQKIAQMIINEIGIKTSEKRKKEDKTVGVGS